MKTTGILLVLFFASAVLADLYAHFPPGGNDRNREANTNRDNGNRLFDSQNNAKGGYCRSKQKLKFYEGSLVQISWTNQHGCGPDNGKLECNLVIQYMCSKDLRDGTGTGTIDPANPLDPATGMHETAAYYQACSTRRRNDGLFIADRENNGGLNRKGSARITRQNQNGGRRGLECPEERDYYPYWHPSPWRDIVVFTHDTGLCDWYKSESQNVKAKHECVDKDTGAAKEANNKADCGRETNAEWRAVRAFGIGRPDCLPAPWARDNHLGAGKDGVLNNYNWIIPSLDKLPTKTVTMSKFDLREAETEAGNNNVGLVGETDDYTVSPCVLRMRYNISANGNDAPANWNGPNDFIDWRYNREASPVSQDPRVTVQGFELELAIDTSQFGRTFQDRTHVFYLMNRPSSVEPQRRIYNIGALGKRGNIVQAYPAMEYNYVPFGLEITKGDYVHFQFVGCDQNPQGNAGQGAAGTDRQNVVQTSDEAASYPASPKWLAKNPQLIPNDKKRMYLAFGFAGQGVTCDPNENNDQENDNCKLLNPDQKHYLNAGLIQMNTASTFTYMNTRNNNFTNRGQKGKLVVKNLLPSWAVALVVVGSVLFAGAAAVAGLIFYGRTHPHSPVNNFLSKL